VCITCRYLSPALLKEEGVKIIEAMKMVQSLQVKAEDLVEKVKGHSAHMDYETPPYGDKQKEIVRGWIQAHRDLLFEIINLKTRISRTNLVTKVDIAVGGKVVTHTIAEWVIRRGAGRDKAGMAQAELRMWKSLTDRGLRDELKSSNVPGSPPTKLCVVRYFDIVERDAHITALTAEPGQIDAALEVANAITDLVD
jgi:hypothetical protein